MGNAFTARDILDQLDDDARSRGAFFPDLEHPYDYHVDARLTAYGDEERWAIVIEQLHVNPRWGSFAGVGTIIYFHGNCIDLSAEQDAGKADWVLLADILSDGPSGPLLTESWSEAISPTTTDVRIRGQVIPIRTDENYYWSRRIGDDRLTHEQIDQWIAMAREHLSPAMAAEQIRSYEQMREKVGKFELSTWNFMRGLVPEHRELLLATEAERRRGLPHDLPLMLQCDQWDHPRLFDGELPSSSDALKQIAKVLATGDKRHWTFDPEEGNIHWSNWPESGSL